MVKFHILFIREHMEQKVSFILLNKQKATIPSQINKQNPFSRIFYPTNRQLSFPQLNEAQYLFFTHSINLLTLSQLLLLRNSMSSIQSLGICGIRGYSPDNYQRIQFIKPLTLIWGKNGSGKTTIIECLKYITTGALPPNSDKGKSFIMDTKVAGKPEVVGDIRLVFTTGVRKILAKRRIQLSAKGNTSRFESIQQSLKTKGEKGQQLTINHQCAQIQKQVPMFLGISKPILQNIVFCHQDESLWPFGDSTLLKNIFDQLFETKKITKQMQRMWQSHKEQQTQLKELKVRLQYEKQVYKREEEQRSRIFQELENIRVNARGMAEKKERILELREKLKDTTEMAKERDMVILRQGRLISSVKALEGKIKYWKQNMLRVEKSHQQKMKGRSNNTFDDHSFINPSHNVTINQQFSQHQLSNVHFVEIDSAQKGIQQLQQKRQVYQELTAKYKAVKEQYEMMRAFKETTKREQEIRSEMDRVRGMFPEMRLVAGVKTDEDFLKVFKVKLVEMEQKIQGIELSKARVRAFEKGIPPVVQLGFSEKQVEQIKKQSKQLQGYLSSASVKLLKIYKAQQKPIPGRISTPMTPSQLTRGQSIITQLQSLTAIIESKQKQLQNYEKIIDSPEHLNRAHIDSKINHYKYAGIVMQDEMLHYCEEKGKCHFCGKEMSGKEVDEVKKKVEMLKGKAEQKLVQLKAQLDGLQVDPQAMVKMLKEEIQKLSDRKTALSFQANRFEQQKQVSAQIQTNQQLAKQLQKCNLSLEMLPKLSHVVQSQPQPQEYYKKVPIEQYVELSSAYQVKLARYRGVKEQANKIENNKRQNQINKQRREVAIREKAELQVAINKAQDQIRGYQFLKNSYTKLQSLIRMQVKSKNKRGHNNNRDQQSSQNSSNNSNMSIEDSQRTMRELYLNILQEKVQIERLQIAVGYWNDSQYLKQEKGQLQQVQLKLNTLGKELKTSQQITATYNSLYLYFTRQSQRHRHHLTTITNTLQTPLSLIHLTTLNKIRHLQASIAHIEQAYHTMQEAVSQYHAQKMQEINRYIYEVWREIYHEQDIQWIEIEARMDEGSKKKKKNYEYRIMMKKSTKNWGNRQEKVEMKGRCSTGQKVLASIVIRLALAEVFCGSTRILALDEPTTNLDKEHVHNLAKALLRLIQLSGGQNLQLIIISHDIEFIQMLEQYADSYYEVSRDENRFSKIEKRMIRDIARRE